MIFKDIYIPYLGLGLAFLDQAKLENNSSYIESRNPDTPFKQGTHFFTDSDYMRDLIFSFVIGFKIDFGWMHLFIEGRSYQKPFKKSLIDEKSFSNDSITGAFLGADLHFDLFKE